MATRDGVPIAIFYARFDLTQTALVQAARADLLFLHRKLRDDFELGVNTNFAGTRAVVKVAMPMGWLPQAQDWFATRAWRAAVLNVVREDRHAEVLAFVSTTQWLTGSAS